MGGRAAPGDNPIGGGRAGGWPMGGREPSEAGDDPIDGSGAANEVGGSGMGSPGRGISPGKGMSIL